MRLRAEREAGFEVELEGAGRAKKTRLAAASSREVGGCPLAVLKSLVREKEQALARNNPDAAAVDAFVFPEEQRLKAAAAAAASSSAAAAAAAASSEDK
jgi:hypothetical protein